MEEIWKDIPGYEGIYQASNLGEIRSAPGKTTYSEKHGKRVWKVRKLKQKQEKSGKRDDFRVCLWKDGVPKDFLVSRLVALAWCDGYEEGLTVNHKDGNYLNNNPDNLEWISREENIRHGYETGLYSSIEKKVRLIDVNDSYVEFCSLVDASLYLGRNKGYLSCAMGRGSLIKDKYGEIYKAILI